jgi:hypothetical protein
MPYFRGYPQAISGIACFFAIPAIRVVRLSAPNWCPTTAKGTR